MASIFEQISSWFLSQPGWVYIIYLALVFSFFFMFVYYFMDRYEREPLKKVLKAFFIGILCIIPAFLIEFAIGSFVSLSPLILVCIIAPVVEEGSKGYGVLRFRKDPEFDGAVDGLVYGGAIGSGFAFVENILYGLSAYTEYDLTAGLELTVIRGMGLAVGHMLFTGYTGSEIGIVKIRKRGFWLKGYFVAVLLHGFWNTISTVISELNAVLGLGALVLLLFGYTIIFRHRFQISQQIDLSEEAKPVKEVPKRPLGITILVILLYLEGFFTVIQGLVFTGAVAIDLIQSPSWIAGYDLVLGFIFILLGIGIMAVGTGLWRLKKGAWLISIIFIGISLILVVAGLPTTWLSFGLYLIVLLYLLGVRKNFSNPRN